MAKQGKSEFKGKSFGVLLSMHEKMSKEVKDAIEVVAEKEAVLVRLRSAMKSAAHKEGIAEIFGMGSVIGNARTGSGLGNLGKGTAGLRATGLPFRVLNVVKGSSGPISLTDIKAKMKLGKKENQLSIALGNLKKRGIIVSTGRGMYAKA